MAARRTRPACGRRSVSVFRGVVLWGHDQAAALAGAPVNSLDDVDHLLLVLHGPVDLVVVAGAQVDHDVLVPAGERRMLTRASQGAPQPTIWRSLGEPPQPTCPKRTHGACPTWACRTPSSQTVLFSATKLCYLVTQTMKLRHALHSPPGPRSPTGAPRVERTGHCCPPACVVTAGGRHFGTCDVDGWFLSNEASTTVVSLLMV